MHHFFPLLALCSLSFLLVGCSPDSPLPPQTTSGNLQSGAILAPEIINGEKQTINDHQYSYYYGQTCSHCKKVEDYLKSSGVDQRIHLNAKEVQMHPEHQEELLAWAKQLNISPAEIGVPFVVIEYADGKKEALIGEEQVLAHFKEMEEAIQAQHHS